MELTWDELADVFNKNLRDEDEYWTSSAYRKKYQQAKLFYDEVFSKMESNDVFERNQEQMRELEQLKIQFRDERNAWNKQNYIDARVSQKLDYLEDKLQDFGKTKYEVRNYFVDKNSDNDILILLSDLHIGQTFDSKWGEYNSDIAKERLNQLLNEVLIIKNRHNSENVFVSIQGDLVSGNIHKTIQVTNRENVIDQIKIASELISSFCYELSKEFNHVTITNVSGNHSRIDKKDEALHDERLDDLIGWIVSNSLSHLDNVEFKTDNVDSGIAIMDIRGKEYVNVHGDFDDFNKNGVSKLCLMLKKFPYAITYGHLHTPALDECNEIKMIRGGSLAGSGDPYTVEKRLSGCAAQTVCVCDKNGIVSFYPVELI